MEPTCSAASLELGEPLAGTAPVAPVWLAIEQPGPWGARALTASHLDHELGLRLQRNADDAGIRIALIRRVGRHADAHVGGVRRAFIAVTRPGTTRLYDATLDDPSVLLDLDFASFAEAKPHGFELCDEQLLLVCTNGKRDKCCALKGRALAHDLAEWSTVPKQSLWEADHLGGHRFSPTAVVLPTGYVYGRLDAAAAGAAYTALGKGVVDVENCRGRSTWPRPGQVAELAVRREIGESDPDALTVVSASELAPLPAAEWDVTIAHTDGRDFVARVTGRQADVSRPESCGKAPGQPIVLGASVRPA